MGHTPGPWVAIKDDVFNPNRTWGVSKYLSREQCEEIDGEDATWPSRTEVIAEVCSASNGTDEADAKLMAAAPDLLAACKDLLSWTPPTPPDYDTKGSEAFSPEMKWLIDRQNQARAAIAKAEGREA